MTSLADAIILPTNELTYHHQHMLSSYVSILLVRHFLDEATDAICCATRLQNKSTTNHTGGV